MSSSLSAAAADGRTGPRDERLRWLAPNPNLDMLRAVAVGYVVVSHVYKALSPTDVYPGYHGISLGHVGVYIFFVHTCLVLLLSLERQGVQPARRLTVHFFLRRIFRIYPLSCAVVIVLHSLARTGLLGPVPSIRETLSNLFLIQNVSGDDSLPGALWSLPFEMQMYLVLPVLFFAFRSRVLTTARTIVLWAVTSSAILLLHRLRVDYHLVRFVPCFLGGAIAYARWGRTKHALNPAWLALLIAAFGAFLPALIAHGSPETILSWPLGLLLGYLVPSFSDVRSAVLRKICATVAKYSYSLYLIHQPLADYFFGPRFPLGHAAGAAGFVATVGALTWIGYNFIEVPGMRLGQRILSHYVSRASAATDAAAPTSSPLA